MKKLMLVGVVALLCAAPANAKELLGAQLCAPAAARPNGRPGCSRSRAARSETARSRRPRRSARGRGALLLGDRGRVYGRYAFYYVPDGRLVVQPGMDGQTTTWLKAHGALGGLLGRLAARLRPFPAPKLVDVAINGKLASDPQSYLRLYSIGSEAKTYPTDLRSVQIVLETAHRTPWSDGNNLVVYPGSNLLLRDGEIVSISGDVADRAANGGESCRRR